MDYTLFYFGKWVKKSANQIHTSSQSFSVERNFFTDVTCKPRSNLKLWQEKVICTVYFLHSFHLENRISQGPVSNYASNAKNYIL